MKWEFRPGIWACVLLAAASAGALGRQGAAAEAPRGVNLVRGPGKTQLWVDGAPFFIHAAEFPYFRLPADLWERSLEEHHALGINTIELTIPWNWHEPRSGEIDFEGRTNPRRNLRKLLRLITEKEMKLMVRAPARIPDWRRDGLPDWVEPGAAQTEMQSRFLKALAAQLAAYLPTKAITIPDRESGKDNAQKTVSGPLMLVMLPQASDAENLRAAGIDVPVFFTQSQPEAESWLAARKLPHLKEQTTRPAPGTPPSTRIHMSTFAETQFIAARLTPAGEFLPLLRDAFPGDRAPAGDVRAVENSLADGLLLSRLALAQGVAGIHYGPIQDSLDPVGFTAHGANRFARIDAALDLNGGRLPAAQSILRNGMLLDFWAEFLGRAEKRVDMAMVTSEAGKDLRENWLAVSRTAQPVGISVGAVDPARQPIEQILRVPILFWNTHAATAPNETAQSALMEYVRRGGNLIVFPERPSGVAFANVWSATESAPGMRALGKGKILEIASDPFAKLVEAVKDDSPLDAETLRSAGERLRQWMRMAEYQPVIRTLNSAETALVLSELVPTTGTKALGERGMNGGPGLLSVTNLSGETVEEEIHVLSPRLSPRARGDAYMRIPVTVADHESLLLPLHAPLCSAAGKNGCDDEILISSAEFLLAERDGKQLELTFYAPARSMVRLRLEEQPSRVRADEMSIDGIWTPATRTFEVPIPRGPAPQYLRVLRIQLPYEPHVPKKPEPDKTGRRDYDFAVADAVRFPLAPDAALETYPPLIVLKPDRTGRMVVKAMNYDRMGRGVDFKISGAVKGNSDIGLDSGELGFRRLDLKPEAGNGTKSGLLEGQLEVKSGRDLRNIPLAFIAPNEKLPVTYAFDVDRDGWPEQVLEDHDLRIVVSPESGGRIIGLVDKDSGMSLTNILGMFHDFVADETADAPTPKDLGDAVYASEAVTETEKTALRLTSPDHDGLRVQKTFSITGEQAMEIAYRWRGPGLAARSVFTTLSVPVTLHGDNTTRFCWEKPKPPGEAAKDLPHTAPDMQCEIFAPRGKSITVPQGTRHLEIRAPGSFVLRLEWPAGEMHVEMKNYSAELRFTFPRAPSGAETGSGLLKLSTVVVE